MERVILITGANNGIGLAMNQTLLEMGDRVAALDLSLENLASTPHPNLLPLRCDVTQPAQICSAVDEVLSRWNGIDVLINNARLALFIPFEAHTLDDSAASSK